MRNIAPPRAYRPAQYLDDAGYSIAIGSWRFVAEVCPLGIVDAYTATYPPESRPRPADAVSAA